MKNYLQHCFFVVLLLLGATGSMAQTMLETGKVYHFQNAGNNAKALSANGASDVKIADVNKSDKKQQWYVAKSGDYYTLRNLSNGKYLKGGGQNVYWSLTDEGTDAANKFTVHASNNASTLKTNGTGDYGYMHYGNWHNDIIGYTVDAENSSWDITQIDYSVEEIASLLDQFPATAAEIQGYQSALDAIFADAACSELKSAYTANSMTDEQLLADANYSALPSTLKNMVKKVRGGDWSEANADSGKNGWDNSYAKRFRLQMYEPYSIAGDITSFLKINAHANNDNPTGVYVHEAGKIYVMVEGEIKDGATLRIIDTGSNDRIEDKQAINNGYELTSGLNVIPFSAAGGHLYICYNVDTYNPDGTTSATRFPHKLSEYAPLKIHIEGGAINGFYNACGDFRASAADGSDNLWKQITGVNVDCDADWEYMETRANLSVLPILGHRQMLLFQLEDTNDSEGNLCKGMRSLLPESISVPNKPYNYTGNWDSYGMGLNPTTAKINIFMEAWDRIMYSEHATLGLVSKPDMDKLNDFYPRWKSDGSRAEIYDYNNVGPDGKTYQEFCDGVDYSEYFNHHGVALGTTSGFMSAGWNAANYNINTFGELMGMANSAGSIWGPAHEIGHQHQDVFNIRGGTEVTNNVFSNAAVWYMGIATSRYSDGHLKTTLDCYNSGKAFIDYNIWSMTQMLYKLWLYYHLAGNNTQFYPRFFEMLRHDPLNAMAGRVNGSESMLKMYEKVCDAAGEDLTEFFRVHGFFVLLDEYAKEDYGTTVFTQTQEEVDAAIARVKSKYSKENLSILLINDGAEPTVSHDGVTLRQIYDGNTSSEMGSVNDFIDGTADVTAAYTAVFNADGTATMSNGEGGVGFLIFDENGKLISFSDRNTFALSDEAKMAVVSGTATFVSLNTENETVVAAVDLNTIKKDILGEIIAKAEVLVEKIDDTYTKVGFYKRVALTSLVDALDVANEVYNNGTGYEGAYEMLYAEYQKVVADNDAKIPFDASLTYIITNAHYAGNVMYVNTTGDYPGVCYSTSVGTEAATSRWQFKETSTPGVYNVYNTGGYYCAEVANNSQLTTTTTATENAVYKLQELSDGVWAIRRVPLSDDRNIHAQGNTGKIIGWGINSPASGWYLTAVEPNTTIEALAELQALASKTKALVDEVASISYTKGEAIALQTTNPDGNYYLSSNAPSLAEGSIDNLVDGETNNHFHTDYSAGEVESGLHYLTVNFCNAAGLDRFLFSYTTRSAVMNDFPSGIEIYGSNDDSSYKLLGSVNKLPQSSGQYWEATDAVITAPYKYLRFKVHASRGYWHMAEFDIYPVASVSAALRDKYDGDIAIDKVTAAYEAYMSAYALMAGVAPSTDDITAKMSALQPAYNALLDEYNAMIDTRKAALATLVADAETLIATVGTVELSIAEPLILTTDNFYCNAPHSDSESGDDYSVNYVEKLTDKSATTYLHTDYNSTSALPHYLRVDLGENPTVKNFKFNYTTRDNGNNCPTTIVVEGSNDEDGEYTVIRTFTRDADGLPNPEQNKAGGVAEAYESKVISSPKAYRYIRFKVTGVEGGSSATYFVISEFGFSKVTDNVAVKGSYSEIVTEDMLLSTYFVKEASSTMCNANNNILSVGMLDAQIAEMEESYTALNNLVNNLGNQKTILQSLARATQELLDHMTVDGTIKEHYTTSALTAENISDARTSIQQAEALGSSVDYNAIAAAIDDLQAIHDILLAVYESEFFDKDGLSPAISDMETLLSSLSNVIQSSTSVPLQATDVNADYYIWCNAPAGDSQGVAGILDKNDDGSAKTNTFLGTDWHGGAVESYTHYLEIDMGGMALGEFSFDYTTRDGDQVSERPTAFKILASKDKNVYDEITTISEGLVTGRCEKWTMESTVDLGGYYRYIRLAVATSAGYFNMSDFNLYAHDAVAFTDYYSAMPLEDGRLNEICDALKNAKEARDKYVTENDYNSIVAGLQAMYAELNTLKNLDYDGDRTALEGLVTDEMINTVMSLDTKETTLPLQCADVEAPYYLFCNAPGTTNNYSGDNLGVAAALDMVNGAPDRTTFLHTTYTGNGYSDELDHYLRLDMGSGQALVSFKFGYKPRSGNTDNAPKVILVEGCNDLENGEFEEIATLTNLPTEYNSGEITNGKAYRYVRFMVKETHNNSKHNGHPFFALDHFAVSSCKAAVVKEYYAGALGVGFVADAYNTKPLVQDIVNRYVTETDYNSALEKLLATADALQAFLDEDYDGDRNAYDEMLANTAQLVADAYEGTALPLQCDDAEAPYYLFSNAPGTTNNWDGDNSGVAAVIDLNDNGEPNLDTFLHTTYYGDGCSDNLDHYLRLDMGEGKSITAFKFSYTPRSGYERNSPTKIVIEGCNDLASGVFEEITTLIGLTGAAYQSGVITNDNAYRYIRFVVEETKDGDNYSYKGHPYFSMSHFTVNSCDIKEYYTTSPVEYIHDACVEMTKAQKVKGHYITESEYETAYNNLQTAYNNLQGLMDADVTERTAFEQLVADTEALIAEMTATIDFEEALIPLQCDDEDAPYYIFCNASETSTTYEDDNLGVAALLDFEENGDPKTSTHLHTSYSGNDQYDDLDHYLRVDMGESNLLSFKFSYIPRSNTGNAPKVILIEGSNDLENGEFEEITTLVDLPAAFQAYQSDEITNGKVYRYIRFMVKETANNDKYKEHPYFALSHFEMTSCKKFALRDDYDYGLNFKPELIVTAYGEKEEAKAILPYYALADEYYRAFNELKAANDALNVVKYAKDMPVILTTDVNNPVLYRIKINRGNEKVFEYDGSEEESSKMPILAAAEHGNKYQAWYFMQGTNAERYDDVLIIPYYNNGAKNTELKLGYPNINDTTKPVVSVEESNGYNWYITFTSTGEHVTAEGWWNLQPEGGSDVNAFVNQQGGGSGTVLSFWRNAANPSDAGSQFKFILDETDYSLPDSYFELYELSQTCGGEKVAGNRIGMYIAVEDYNSAYNAAAEMLEAKSATDDEYTLAKETLSSEINALERRVPVEDRFYILRSAYVGGYSENNVVYVGDSIDMYFSGSYDELSSRAIWQFENVNGGYRMKNFHTGAYVDAFYSGAHAHLVNEDAGTLTYEILDENNGILNIKSSENLMHAQASGNKIVGWGGGLNTASAWYIEEISNTDIEEIYYPYTLSALGCGTLMLGFDAVIPEGVTAYYAEYLDGMYVHMEAVSEILPANTAVILKSNTELDEPLSLRFKYSTTSGIPVEGNMLAGTLYRKVVKCDTETVDNKVYVMQAKNGEARMYRAYENLNSDGSITEIDGSKNHDEGGHIMNSANRAYLVVPQVQAMQSVFNLRFGAFTDVEAVVNDTENAEAIYDLQGRKVAKPAKGIYIINGHKVVIK